MHPLNKLNNSIRETTMSQKRSFVLELKNDQSITLEFTSIEATSDQLWQMFATTEALDTVQQLISQADLTQTRSAKKIAPNIISDVPVKTSKKKK
jgi:hypothetical protein